MYSAQQHKPSFIHLKSDKVSVFALFNVLMAEASHRRLSLEHLAQEFHITRGYFNTYFKQYGVSLKQLSSIIRSNWLTLALITHMSMAEIAAELQFTDVGHFTRVYQKFKGGLPVKR